MSLSLSLPLSLSAPSASTRSVSKSNISIYQAEYHPVARTRESDPNLVNYFSEVDPDEPTTSATTTVHSASIFDRDARETESSETSRNSARRCRLIPAQI
jgi:hypothetical protein